MNKLFTETKNENAIPVNSGFSDWVTAMIEDKLAGIKDRQEWIGLMISLKENEPYFSERWQWCKYFLNLDKTYLENEFKDLKRFRREYERLT